MIQVGQDNGRGANFDLGVQSTTTFNATEENKPYIFYIAGDNDR